MLSQVKSITTRHVYIKRKYQQNCISTLITISPVATSELNEDQLKEPLALHIIHARKKKKKKERKGNLYYKKMQHTLCPAVFCFVPASLFHRAVIIHVGPAAALTL